MGYIDVLLIKSLDMGVARTLTASDAGSWTSLLAASLAPGASPTALHLQCGCGSFVGVIGNRMTCRTCGPHVTRFDPLHEQSGPTIGTAQLRKRAAEECSLYGLHSTA